MIKNINKQHTIADAIRIEGVGLQTNQKTKLSLLPAEPNSGINFVRVDIASRPVIPADCDLVISTDRCTKLGKDDVSVSTIEHLLAALKGCFIDNVTIEVDGQEIPILDGSSQGFVDAILHAGIKEQEEGKTWWDINEMIMSRDEEKGSELVVVPSSEYRLSAVIGFPGKAIDLQHATLNNINLFKNEIAPARTFCFYSEIEELVDQGLIKGGDKNNALIIIDKQPSEEIKRKITENNTFYQNQDYITHKQVRFPNEPARHKLLDIIGDLSLCGYSFKGHVIANKPGHKTNIELAKKIKRYIKDKDKAFNSMHYLQQKEYVFDINQVMSILPHRYPFLLIDKVLELKQNEIVATKAVTINELFFQGHFPGNPVMPGVLIVEAMAQAGGFLIFGAKKHPENFDPYFLKIDQCKFKRKVYPGDTLIIRVQSIFSNQRGLNEMKGQVFVQDNLCCEATVIIQAIEKSNKKQQ